MLPGFLVLLFRLIFGLIVWKLERTVCIDVCRYYRVQSHVIYVHTYRILTYIHTYMVFLIFICVMFT